MTTNTLYLSLGSNIEPKKEHLATAIQCLKNELGSIIDISSFYETPAWGFDSDSFINLCLSITTSKDTKQSLNITQQIEKIIGRAPKKEPTYEARKIDIDIIYSSEGIFHYPELNVPHPLMHQRNFVLVPLAEIAPDYMHPLLHKSNLELLDKCEDDGEIVKL